MNKVGFKTRSTIILQVKESEDHIPEQCAITTVRLVKVGSVRPHSTVNLTLPLKRFFSFSVYFSAVYSFMEQFLAVVTKLIIYLNYNKNVHEFIVKIISYTGLFTEHINSKFFGCYNSDDNNRLFSGSISLQKIVR